PVHGDVPVVLLPRAAVVQEGLPVGVDQVLAVGAVVVHLLEDVLDRALPALPGVGLLVPVGAVEHGARDPQGGLGHGRGLATVLRGGGLALPAVAGGGPQAGPPGPPPVPAGRGPRRGGDDCAVRAVGQVGHVLDRQDLGDHTLVAVAAGELVALGDLALLRDVDPHQLVHARRQLVAVLPGEHAHVDDLARLAVRDLQRRVANLAG